MDKPACFARDTSSEAPHRPWFAVGCGLGAAAALWWAVALAGVGAPPPSTPSVPLVTMHALWMTFGLFPPFIAGFACVAMPRWLRAGGPLLAHADRLAAVYGLGLVTTCLGLFFGPGWMAAGLTLSALSWWRLTLGVARAVRDSRSTDRLHAIGVAVALAVIAVALAAAALSCALEHPTLLQASARLGLGLGAGTAYAFAAHRMTPFLQPPRENWPSLLTLAGVLSCFGGMTLRAVATATTGVWPEALVLLQHGVCVATAALLMATAILDADVRRACRTPMMRHLRAGVLWLCAALLASALTGIAPLRERWPGLESAALHMLTLGFMGTTVLAQATRVAATQSGLALVIDRHGRWLHLLLQTAVVARVVGSLWPWTAPLVLPAADLGWTLVLTLWGWRWLRRLPRAPGATGPGRTGGSRGSSRTA